MTNDGARSFGWELWSLALWWAIWSIGDAFLLRFSPWPEVCVLISCVTIAVGLRVKSKRVPKDAIELAS